MADCLISVRGTGQTLSPKGISCGASTAPRRARALPSAGLRVLAACLCALAGAPVCAQTALADPTRPPGVSAAVEAVGEAAGRPVLQSVLLPKKGAAVAIINGRQIRLGESFGDSRLVAVSEREAVLSGPSGVERLSLTPSVDKRTRAAWGSGANTTPAGRHRSP